MSRTPLCLKTRGSSRRGGATIINPDGTVVAPTWRRNKHLVLVGDVRLGAGRRSPYTRLGDLLGWLMLAFFIFSIAFPLVVRQRVKKQAAQQGERECQAGRI